MTGKRRHFQPLSPTRKGESEVKEFTQETGHPTWWARGSDQPQLPELRVWWPKHPAAGGSCLLSLPPHPKALLPCTVAWEALGARGVGGRGGLEHPQLLGLLHHSARLLVLNLEGRGFKASERKNEDLPPCQLHFSKFVSRLEIDADFSG